MLQQVMPPTPGLNRYQPQKPKPFPGMRPPGMGIQPGMTSAESVGGGPMGGPQLSPNMGGGPMPGGPGLSGSAQPGGSMTPVAPRPAYSPMNQAPMNQAPNAPGPMPVTPGLSGGVATPQANPMNRGQGARPPTGPGNTNPDWMPQSGVSPFDASSGATGIGDFQRFSDNAYNESVRRLDPQFATQQRSFEQDMVNRGIAPGTEAYDAARANFDQSRNDAYAGARAAADQQGLAAQQQSFGQGATNSGLLNQLLQARMGADASRYGAQTSANASMHNANTAAQSAAERLGYDQQQGDFGNLMQLLGFGSGVNSQNNGAIGQNNNANNQQFGNNMGLLGLFGGGSTPNNIDVTSGYNNQYNAGLNQSQYNQQQQNSNNQMYASLFASMMCDRNAKDDFGPADPEQALKAIEAIPYHTWSYKDDGVLHVGTFAQDFARELGLPNETTINHIDLFGALIGSVQALTARVKELEAA